MVQVPPGATARLAQDEPPTVAIPLWMLWLQIAAEHAVWAAEARKPDELIDALSSRLAGEDRVLPDWSPGGSETKSSMVAVAAAAHALDGFYGSIKPLIPPPHPGGNRGRHIVELLKLAFDLGSAPHGWARDVDWLFKTRDDGVHHGERHRPLLVGRMTSETVVYSGAESFNFSAPSAARAASLVTDVVVACLDNPRPATQAWVDDRRPTLVSVLSELPPLG